MSLLLPSVLTIAGSDSSGGAGIQADLKTITALGLYGSSVITNLTAQNTIGVHVTEPVSQNMLAAQLDAVLSDIPPQAVKIGMVGTSYAIEIITQKLLNFPKVPVVTDPVMISTSGRRLLDETAMHVLTDRLFSISTLITPNIQEAEALLFKEEREIHTIKDIEEAACQLSEKFCTSVLLKGGHRAEGADDVLYHHGIITWFPGTRINNPNTHGTGCTLSSAIACGLAKGMNLEESILTAKEYLNGALSAGLNIGKGNGPLWHGWKTDISDYTIKNWNPRNII